MKIFLKNNRYKFIKTLFVFIMPFAIVSTVYSQSVTEEDAKNCFSIIDSGNRYINDLLTLMSNDKEAYNLPLGIRKIVGGSSYDLAISNIKIGSTYGEITLFLKIKNIYKSRELIFGATGVKISYTGDLIGDVKFALLSDIPISLGNMGSVILKGSLDVKTGASMSKTYLSVNCNGDFKELSIDGELLLNENTFTLARTGGVVRTSFRANIFDLNDLLLELSIPKFEIKGIPGFEFALSKVTLDMSDTRNPSALAVNGDYFQNHFSLPDKNLWRGVYAKDIEITFPSMFDKKGNGGKASLIAHNFLIDENGITGDITGVNILPFEFGDASGCSFSVTAFMLGFETNNIKKFGFSGEIAIPMTENSKPLHYDAFISGNEYLFNVSLGEKMEFNLFGAGELSLMPTSFMQIGVTNGKFVPKVILDGYMTLNAGGLSIGQLGFKKLCLSAQSPIFSVESVICGGNISLQNFPITISNFNFSAKNNTASLGFNLKINLMESAISASSSVKLNSEYSNNKWNFKGLTIDGILLDNINLAGFSLSGEIQLAKDDPDYGNYFGGQINATFGALSNALSVKLKAVFGQKGFRYWYAEGNANFSPGIPVGIVSLNGFTGGAYYRMQPTGGNGIKAYIPNENVSLGVKAGVSFHIAANNIIAGNALFEMNFLSSGGIGSIMFYGNAKFLDAESLTGDKYKQYYSSAQKNLKDFGTSFSSGLPGNLDGSDVAKKILPDVDLSGAITAALSIKYEFTTRTFDANFRVSINLLGILTGAGNNNEAGWVHMYCSPQTWFIHAGTPSNPIGLKLGLGSFSLKTESYLMVGNQLEKPIIDPKIADILHIRSEETEFMKQSEKMATGKGFAFGSRFSFDTGDLRFLFLYARFAAGIGFDAIMSDMSAFRCAGSNSPIGINGWRAAGQCYAYLSGELGAKINLLFIKKNIVIIKGSAGALLQVILPNPTWVGGYMAINLNVLGIIKANMKMKFSFGNECQLVSADGNYTPLDFPVIADINPKDNEKDVDVFLSPQVTFNLNPGEEFDIQDDDGNTKIYRTRIMDLYITNSEGQKIKGNIKLGKMTATFESFEILPPYSDLQLKVSVGFEEKSGGLWREVSENGKPARETQTVKFTTGGAPNYIPLANIEYCYPVIGQKNFFKGESQEGYVQLKKGQSYLFPLNFDYRTEFTITGESSKENKFQYIESERRLKFNFPALDNRKDYAISFVAYSTETSQQAESQTAKKVTVSEGDEAFNINYMQQAAQKIIQDGSMKLLDYAFRTSGFNTFEEKMTAMSLTKGFIIVDDDIRLLYFNVGANEMFDAIETDGSIYTGEKPLVQMEAILDNPYYTIDIEQITYSLLSINGMVITNRDPKFAGAPPVRGFLVMDGYFTGNTAAAKTLPWTYALLHYYKYDFLELRDRAANLLKNGQRNAALENVIQKQFPFIRSGNYKVQMKYMLPGDKQGTTKQLIYMY